MKLAGQLEPSALTRPAMQPGRIRARVSVRLRERARAVLPFVAVGVVAEASAFLPPGPQDMVALLASAGLLAVVTAAVMFVPWEYAPEWSRLIPVIIYVLAGALLVLSEGSPTASGLLIVLIFPITWVAIYHPPRDSILVGIAVLIALMSLSIVSHDSAAAILRRVILWSCASALIVTATWALRGRLSRVGQREGERSRQLDALMSASRELTSIHDSNALIDAGLHWAMQLASPPGARYRRAQYLQVKGDQVVNARQYDEAGCHVSDMYPLTEHPLLAEVVRTGRAKTGHIELEALGPKARRLIGAIGVTHAVWVPVNIHGTLHGILAVSSRGQTFSRDLLATLKSLASLVELALGNALSREQLSSLAITDALTGVANRRGFESFSTKRPRDMRFAILSFDLDDLKEVNDAHGHARGDVLLTTVASIATQVVREGDILARMGGDEFCAFLYDADASGAVIVATRILAALARTAVAGVSPRVSIGIAASAGDGDVAAVVNLADSAMYRAKRQGGMRYALAGPAEPSAEEMGLSPAKAAQGSRRITSRKS